LKTIVKPSISWPEMGRLFGGRDHTTVLHGVRAHAARVNGKEG
jgi:chromosomal replication initiation ATPase DnaA